MDLERKAAAELEPPRKRVPPGKSLEKIVLPHYTQEELSQLPPHRARFLVKKDTLSSAALRYTDADAMACQKDYLRELLPILAAREEILCYEFENEVNKFIEDNTICIVGYNSSDCSVCKEIPTVEEKYQLEQDGVLQTRFASIVPLAVDRIFFILLKLKTQALVEMAQYL